MSVNKDEVKNIAKLAKLKLSESEVEEFTGDMNKILDYMDKLNELDTGNVKPLYHPLEGTNVFRDDQLKNSINREDALKNAPQRTEEFFKVPKVIKTDKK
ncbi:MAG: Asp-tRNA(Asn)/Glu-tRNA(Gln) amidotransferase subunit GatC [Melioribacteraceae bacterium]|nr:Asp-tRNA(Asn)/Glu-tRNA(Gln) amidotransferase subunit GatC [Melioribacteraceae bacterium]